MRGTEAAVEIWWPESTDWSEVTVSAGAVAIVGGGKYGLDKLSPTRRESKLFWNKIVDF